MFDQHWQGLNLNWKPEVTLDWHLLTAPYLMWNSRIRKILFSKTVHENQILPHVTHHRCSSSHNSGKNVRKCNVVVATNCPLVGISDIHHDDEEEEEVCNLRYRRQLVRRDKNLWRIRSLVMMSAVTFSLSYFFHYFFLEVVITIKSVALFVLSFRLFFWLVQLFCRRNIQRSERKGSFLKNGMILSCRIESGFRNHSHHKKRIFDDVLDRSCTVCKVKFCSDKLKC